MAADRLGVAQGVGAEQHRPPLVPQRPYEVANVAAPERVESRHGLVQKDDLRVVDQRLRDPDALQHAARIRPQPAAALGSDAGPVELPRGPPAALGGRVAEQAPDVRQELFRRAGIGEARRLGQKADPAPDGGVAGRTAEDLGAARRRVDQPHQQPQRRGLAGAVRSEVAEHGAPRDVQRHPVERVMHARSPEAPAERLRELAELNHRHGRVAGRGGRIRPALHQGATDGAGYSPSSPSPPAARSSS